MFNKEDNHYRLFFEMSLDLLCTSTLDGVFVDLNQAWVQLLGYEREELIGAPYAKLVHPDDIERTGKEIAGLSAGEKTIFFENRFLKKNGNHCWLSWTAVVHGGYIFAAARDITEIKKREQLSLQEKAAQETEKLKSDFFAKMSHELRTPLNGIIGMATLLETGIEPSHTEYLNGIKTSADALLKIITDILDFSKLEAHKVRFEEIDFDLHSLVADVQKSFRYSCEEKGLSFPICESGLLPKFVNGDPGRLRQILTNLLANAVKFTDVGAITLKGTASKSEGGVTLKFEVADTGVGIKETALPRLFQPFSQVETLPTRFYGGTGLGLSVCKQLVDYMGGEIGVVSKEGAGSTFWFSVRLKAGRPVLDKKVCPNNLPRFAKQHHVLLAEDNVINLVIAKKMMENMGLRVHAVRNGVEALDALRDKEFDLVVMDCQMPEMDGYDAALSIRRGDVGKNVTGIPIVALTANVMEGDEQKCLHVGMDEYLSKPIAPKALAAVLTKWLDDRDEVKSTVKVY